MKKLLQQAFGDPTTKVFLLVNDVLAITTVVSIVSVVLETVPSLTAYKPLFDVIEWVAVIIFLFEYGARLYITKPWYTYSFSFFGLIDFIAIAPSFLLLGNLTFLKSARAIRLIRLLRMVRLAKLKRKKHSDIDHETSFFLINITIFLVTLVSSVLLVGTLIYLFEGNREAFASIPLAMLWSLKVFLIGIPIAYPETVGGEVVHVFARFVGLIVFGVLIGVSGNVLRDYLFANQRNKSSQ